MLAEGGHTSSVFAAAGAAAFFARGLAVLAFAFVAVAFLGAAAFFAVVVFFGAAFLVAFGLASPASFFGLASFCR